ncbi:MAG TPA: polyprenyl synthetase family protein [Dermatophilaceae bacterium]|nr:polyprenyl synthetase family protein [Dermatophilaceae bacterium]
MASPLDEADLRARVQRHLDAELAARAEALAPLGPDVTDLLDVVAALLAGGKRLRAAFLYWGLRAAGQPDSDAAVRCAAAMELLQAAALLHDDVVDDSDTRRGRPAAHRVLAARHAERGWDGDSDRFGVAGAILAGNLCLAWTDEVYAGCGLPAPDLHRGRPALDRMRTELMAGQFLDVVESVRPWSGVPEAERVARAERVIRYKSAAYSVQGPLLVGASVGGLSGEARTLLSDYALALGHAFQLRDDLLGVFGDPEVTGKPAGDDLREGKRTVLLAHALAGSPPAAVARLEARVGSPDLGDDDVAELRALITRSGAPDVVEGDIARLVADAHAALAAAPGLDPAGRSALGRLVAVATDRAT